MAITPVGTKKKKTVLSPTTAANKAALLPSLEGSLGLPGVPKVAPVKFTLPSVSIPKASSIVQPLQPTDPITGQSAVSTDTSRTGLYGLDEYMNEVKSDPNYAIAEKNYRDALEMGERTLMSDPFRQALISYGYDIGGWNAAHPGTVSQAILDAAGKYLDPAAQKAANENPYSTAAQIGRGYNQATAGLGGDYAMRGTLGSGGMNVAASNLNYQRGLQDKQAMDQFLSALGTANTNWLDFQTSQADRFRQAQEEIATRLAQVAGYHALLNPDGTEDVAGDPTAVHPEGYPFIYADTPNAVGDTSPSPFVPVTVGGQTSYEPKPTAGNYIAAPTTKPKLKPATQKAIAANASKKIKGLGL